MQVGGDAEFDYETQQNYTITIKVQDDGEPPFTVDFNVTLLITDANDPPYDLQLSGKNCIAWSLGLKIWV